MKYPFIAAAALLSSGSFSHAAIVITEWMYQGANGEFVELTNTGSSPVDLTGWSFDDDSNTPGSFDLSSLGVIAAGQSVIISELASADFITAWNLTGISVLGGNTVNLGRNDQINIYDDSDALIDRLTFGDQNIPGSIRTNAVSGVTSPANYGADNVALWTLSSTGSGGATTSAGGDVGSPGFAPVPEPGSLALGVLGAATALLRRRR